MATRCRKPGFPAWIEQTIHLPLGLSAEPGRITLAPYLAEVAASMVDPAVERLTIMKSARIGYSTVLSSLVAWHMTQDPAPILAVLPAELDARNFIIDIESIFEISPKLAGKLPMPSNIDRLARNSLLFRRGKNGASLRLVGATSPRNLRAITARVLLIDEADALLDTAEGDAIGLATARTFTYPDRRIIVGGTPLLESTSHVGREYAASDMRVFEVACPHCAGWFEITWSCIAWPDDHPEQAYCVCPSCGGVIEESRKAGLVRAGRWRPTRLDADPRRRGYRINSLVSSLHNAGWGKLAQEWLGVRDDESQRRVFQNVVLGLPWGEQADEVDESALMRRIEPFSLDAIPREVLALTLGCDVQHDRLEVTLCGWGRDSTCYILSHQVLWGATDEADAEVWRELDHLLKMRWPHPAGGALRIDSAAIDGSDGGRMDIVVGFCAPRLGKRIFAVKGAPGFARASITRSKIKGKPLFIVGVDAIKARLFDKLAKGRGIRFSNTLPAEFFEQLCSEVRVVRVVRGRPTARFERKPGARNAESLDCVTYAHAAFAALHLNFDLRQDELSSPTPPKPPLPTVIPSQWMNR